MQLLAADDCGAWLKRYQASQPERRSAWRCALWPEASLEDQRRLASYLATMSSWKSAVLAVHNSGMPRQSALDELATLRRARSTEPEHASDIWGWPGHIFDAAASVNAGNVAALLEIMMRGYVEGTLATKGGRFVAVVGCGVIDFHVDDKSMRGRLRNADTETALRWMSA